MTYQMPEAVLERHMAILGINGSGKTSVAKAVIAEPLLEAGQRIAVIDPTGVWWGLRLKADGRRPAFDVAIFGGPHGDLPLNAHSGKTVAEAIGTSATPVVLDTIAMTVRERSQFFTDFAETLLRTNKGPLNLIIDECHLFMPQGGAKSGGQVPDMLHAGNNLVSLGRSKGIRVTMITQRPAKLHKDSLTQALTLIAMQVVHPLDREAIEAWIRDNADKDKSREIVSSLGGLKPGEGWIWSPRIDLLKRQQFHLPKTLDTSSGEDTDATLPAMNLDAIKAKLGKVADDLKTNDSRALKAEIAALKRQAVQSAVPAPILASKEDTDRAYVLGHTEGYDQGWRKGWMAGHAAGCEDQVRVFDNLSLPRAFTPQASGPPSIPTKKPPPNITRNITAAPKTQSQTQSTGFPKPPPQVNPITSHTNGSGAGDKSLTGPQRAILSGMAWWKAMGHDAVTRPQLAAKVGWKVGGGHFINRLSELARAGMIAYPKSGVVTLTPEGEAAAPEPDTSATLPNSIRAALTGPQALIFDKLLESGTTLSREDLASIVGWDAKGGHFINRLSELSRMEIIYYPERGHVAMQDWVQ